MVWDAFSRKYTNQIQLRAEPDVEGFEDLPREQRELIRTAWNVKIGCENLIDGLLAETKTGEINKPMRAYNLRAIHDFANDLPNHKYDDLPNQPQVMTPR